MVPNNRSSSPIYSSTKSLTLFSLISLYLPMNTGICIIYLVDGLFLGSTYSKALSMAFKSVEYCEGILGYIPFNTF